MAARFPYRADEPTHPTAEFQGVTLSTRLTQHIARAEIRLHATALLAHFGRLIRGGVCRLIAFAWSHSRVAISPRVAMGCVSAVIAILALYQEWGAPEERRLSITRY